MKKLLTAILISTVFNLSCFAENSEDLNKYHQQWNTVINLQRLIDSNLLKEVPNLFSKRVKEKIEFMITKDSKFFVRTWRLNEYNTKQYKEQIFKGQGLFILEDGEWKIDEI